MQHILIVRNSTSSKIYGTTLLFNFQITDNTCFKSWQPSFSSLPLLQQKGPSLTMSILQLAGMYFLMAAWDDPFLSFKAVMTVVVGWVAAFLEASFFFWGPCKKGRRRVHQTCLSFRCINQNDKIADWLHLIQFQASN